MIVTLNRTKSFISLLYIISISAFSQQWGANKGTKWIYKKSAYSLSQIYIKDTYIEDVMIGTVKFHKIHGQKFSNNSQLESQGYYYTHQIGKVIYFDNDGSNNNGLSLAANDTMIYFGNIGDKWRPHLGKNSSCDSSYIQIIDTDRVVIQGENIRRWKIFYSTSYYLGTSSAITFTGTANIFDKIGFDNICFQYGHCNSIYIPIQGGVDFTYFSCYKDSTIEFTNNSECGIVDQNQTVKIEEYNFIENINIYPNPSNGIFNISNLNNNRFDIKIFNSIGQQTPFIITEKENISFIEVADKGIFIAEIKSGNRFYRKKIIVQ